MTSNNSFLYQKDFFVVQLALAQKIADILQQPLEKIVLRYTAFYRIFGLDWSFDPTNPVWEAYINGLQFSTAKVEYTYEYYLQRYPSIPTSVEEQAHWGCFAYDYDAETRKIRLHFGDYDQSEHGPLSHLRIAQRKEELRAMFWHIQNNHPEALSVVGGSWLYNWESYTRLFPPSFSQTARPREMPSLQGRASWNQLLRRGWRVHPDSMVFFLQKVSQLERVEDYPGCFPYAELWTEAPISIFYEFYG
ncbi:MAG TPA: hypothetical protein VFN23_18860 [Ktedonobacteraceae bacterium]|nr:hypothetical protein [Ktedonobacteraceae bacterium]